MKAIRFFKEFCFLSILMISLTGCKKNSGEYDKPYTPLYIYFNPLKLDMNLETLMPYFVNYPSDWAKMGLKKHPMNVTYEYTSTAWGITTIQQYIFLTNGHLSEKRGTSFHVGSNGLDIIKFEYDNNSNLIGITTTKKGFTDEGFTYDSNNRLIRREPNGQRNYKTFLYSYHKNGVLKSISPEKEDNAIYESGVTLEKMQFDSLAHMVRFESPQTSNPLLRGLDKTYTGKSVTTYTYTDNLCTQAIEKIPIKFDAGTETITCTSTFAYNSHGDLIKWTYSGGVYKQAGNNWRVDNMTFTINYDYEYDNEGNWIQAQITFPTNIDEIQALRIHYKSNTTGYSSLDHSPSVKEGETPFLIIKRNIEYWKEDFVNAVTTVKAETTENNSGLLYKGTDTYGILGHVKSVTEEHVRWEFDKSGNLVYHKNSYGLETIYKYTSPTSYTINNWKDASINITIKEGSRSDMDSGINTEVNQQYSFDNQKRLTKHVYCSHMAIITCTYQYKGDNKYPSTMIEEHSRDGITTYTYQYIKFDKKNNWTERNVNCITEYDEYDENFEYIGKKKSDPYEYKEIRQIEYW